MDESKWNHQHAKLRKIQLKEGLFLKNVKINKDTDI